MGLMAIPSTRVYHSVGSTVLRCQLHLMDTIYIIRLLISFASSTSSTFMRSSSGPTPLLNQEAWMVEGRVSICHWLVWEWKHVLSCESSNAHSCFPVPRRHFLPYRTSTLGLNNKGRTADLLYTFCKIQGYVLLIEPVVAFPYNSVLASNLCLTLELYIYRAIHV